MVNTNLSYPYLMAELMNLLQLNENTAGLCITVEAIAKGRFGAVTPFGYKEVEITNDVATIIGDLTRPACVTNFTNKAPTMSLRGTIESANVKFHTAFKGKVDAKKARRDAMHIPRANQNEVRTCEHPMLEGKFRVEGGNVISWEQEEVVYLFNGSHSTFGTEKEVIKIPVSVRANAMHLLPWYINSSLFNLVS